MNKKYNTEAERAQAFRQTHIKGAKKWREKQKVMREEYKQMKEMMQKMNSV